MKITGLDIERFGIWRGLQLGGLREGLSVFYGPNEAGKTTVMEFLRSVFYGYTEERRRYLPIVKRQGRTRRGAAGGYVSVQAPGGRFEVSRFYDPARAEDERERLQIMGADGTRQGEHMLQVLLGNLDETTFNNVFAIGLDELQRLSTLDDTEAADLLYRLSIGLDRVSLVEVMETLVQSRNHLLDVHGEPAKIDQLFQRRASLVEEIREGRGLLREYTRVLNEKKRLDQQTHQIEEEHEKHRHEARILEIAIQVRRRWRERDRLHQRVEEMSPVEPVSEETVKQLVDLEKTMDQRREQIAEFRGQYRRLREEAQKLDINETLWKMAPRIEILQQQGDWITSLKQRVDTLESEVHTAQEELTQGHREIGVDHDAVAGEPEPVPRTIDTFRGPARTIRRAKARLKKAKEQLADLQEKDRLLTERLENEMDRHGATDLSQAIERLSELTALLRRRQGLSERMAEMENYLAEMEDQNAYLIENQALPLPALAGLGLLAIGGAVLATLWGLGHIHVLFGILGLVAIAAGIGVKIYVERSNARKLEGNQRQLSLLMSQIEQAREESAAIDVKLPPGEGAIDYQMEKAERQLAALEQLVPYETQRREIERQIVSAKEHLETLQRTLHAAMKRWRDLLQRARLPVDLTPVQVKDVLARYDEMGDLRRRKDQRQEELHQKKRELEQVSQRIDQLIAETGVSFPDAWGVLEKLRQLGERLSENENLLKQRETLREQARQIRRQGNKAKTLLAQQSRRRRERLVEFGVESTQELVARSERYSEYLQLVHQRQRVQQEIDAAIGGYCGEEVIARQLAPGRRDHLEKILEQTRRRIDAAKDRLRHTLQHQGQLAERLETLSRDRTSARKHLELGTLHEKLRNAKSQWQQRAVACRILEDIRQHYERDRQPETLQEASAFFRRLTRDGYRRVWTPMGENSLYVDDPQGNTFDVQWLSRGTREQLFVALRLALAASFARRGALLPVVMDDVLVNFDMARAASAAAVLRQFAASGRQVLLFTCHRHVCRIFEMLEVPVHTLPSPKPAKRSLASAPAPKKEEDEVDNHSEAPPSNKEEIPVEQTTDHEPIEDEEDLPYESEEERREEEYEEENLEDEAPLEPEEESEPEEETPLAEKSSETVVLRLDPPTAEDKMEMEERPPLAPPTPTPLAADEDSTDSFEEQEPYLPFENDESYPSTAFVSRVENAIGFFNGEEYFDDYLLHDSAEETENAEPEYRNSETERFPREVGETSNTDELTEILEESPADPSEEEAAGEMVEEKMSDETEIDPDSEMDLFSEDIASQTINDDLNDESAETTTVENIEPEETTEGTAEFLPSETEPEKDPPSSFEEPLFPEEDASREWDDYDQAEDWQEEEAESPDETPEALGEEEAAFEVEDESDEEWYEDDEDEDEEGHVDEPPWDEDIEEFDDYEEYDDEEWEEEEDE